MNAIPGIAAAACALLLAAPVEAAQDRAILHEIIVSAQKREQDIQDVPNSITAASGAELRQRGITDTTGLAALAPGLSFGSPVGAGNNPAFALRGVGLNDFSDNNESPVAIYVDEIYQASLAGQTIALFDIARVEVLRGPQGTLYGRNATGGLLHVITNRPTTKLDLTGQVTASQYGGRGAEFAINGPLSPRAQARLAGVIEQDDGWFRNTLPGAGSTRRNETDRHGLRGFLNLELSDRTRVLIGAHTGGTDVLAAVYGHQGTAGLHPDFGNPAGGCFVQDPDLDCFGYIDTDGDWFGGASDRSGELSIEVSGAMLNAAWQGDTLTVTWLAGYEHAGKYHAEDTDAGPFALVEPLFTASSNSLSQELRVDGATERMQWVGGLYYFDWEVSGSQQLALPFLSEREIISTPFLLDTTFDQSTRSSAVFGQVEYALHDTVTLRSGLRWTSEKKKYDYQQVDRHGGVRESAGFDPVPGLVLLEFNAATAGSLATIDADEWSGQLGLSWQPIPEFMLFGNIARGFKSGGFNAGFVTPPPADPADPASPPDLSVIPYGNETLTSYELGMKWTLLGGRARLNATAFHYTYDDVQTPSFLHYSSFISNVAAADINGAEVELAVRPFAGLDLQLGASLLDTQARRVSNPEGGFSPDRELVLAPDYALNGLARYERETGFGSWFVQADFTARGAHYFDIRNQPVARENGYVLFDARAGVTFGERGRYELAIWGRNLGNEKYLVYTVDFTRSFGFNQRMVGPPRGLGVTFSARL
jgi:iron complex outermembrane receptor protein